MSAFVAALMHTLLNSSLSVVMEDIIIKGQNHPNTFFVLSIVRVNDIKMLIGIL